MVSALFKGNIHCINKNSCNYDVSTICVRGGKGHAPSHSLRGHGLTDVDILMRTGVAYNMQVNGLLPFTDTGTLTRMGVAWPFVFK